MAPSRKPAKQPPPPDEGLPDDSIHKTLSRRAIFDAFDEEDHKRRERLGLPKDHQTTAPVMVELNLRHKQGLVGAELTFLQLFDKELRGRKELPDRDPPQKIADTYYRCIITVDEATGLVKEDEKPAGKIVPPKERSIYRVWPDFDVRPQMDRSIATVKADAARRSFDATGRNIVWAVIDSGIDANHPHFRTYDTLGGDVAELHRDFTIPELDKDDLEKLDKKDADDKREADRQERIKSALKDARGHGTHVAGIIAGALPIEGLPVSGNGSASGAAASSSGAAERKFPDVRVCLRRDVGVEERTDAVVLDQLAGVAPRCKLVSLKVLPDKRGVNTDSSSNVLRALQYVREKINGEGKLQRIHGINLSLGYEFDARWFACGQSPICVEVDRLVRSGVVVVVAAGNTGYGNLSSREGNTSTGLALTINDPGNSSLAITVGATHRDSPHTYGVSFFSSKGPTGDGRLKPDLVAPGERITSCATGQFMKPLESLLEEHGWDASKIPAPYIDESGTSMAAPHVSGAIAAFLSIRSEFIGRTEEVKRIFLDTATSLGRERYFEGHGLVDLMRAIQSV